VKLLRVLSAGLLLAAVGCADDEESATLPCNVSSRACQKAVFRATAAARGQPGAQLPNVRVITRKVLAEELQSEFDDSASMLDVAEALRGRQSQQAMALLHLMPEPAEQSSDDAYVEQAVNGIAAYYSSYSKDITIIADQAEDVENGTFTLSHEFVHALQDQRVGLNAWRKPLVTTSDDSVSTKSLTEGEAVWLSYVTYYGAVHDARPEDIAIERIFPPMLSGFLGQIEESSAPFINALETLPYPMGGRQVSHLYLASGEAAVSRLYAEPRLTLREWADAEVGELPEALECDVPAAPEGYTRILSDRLGFAGLLSFHTGLGWDGATAYAGALPWRADEVVGYASMADPEAVVVAWRVRLETAVDANAVALLARDADLVAVTKGAEALIVGATSAGLLDTWLPFEGCVSNDKGRAEGARGRLQTLAEKLGIER